MTLGIGIVALVVLIAQVERKGVLQAMLSRPLVLGALLGALLGDLQGGILIGAVLELLWLGAINVGENLPDNEVIGTGAVVGAALLAVDEGPLPLDVATLALVLLAPLSMLGKYLDATFEKRNTIILSRLEQDLQSGQVSASLNLVGLIAPAFSAALLSALAAALGALLISWLTELLPDLARAGLALGFPMITVGSAAFALSSIRARRAMPLAAVGAAVGILALLAGHAAGVLG